MMAEAGENASLANFSDKWKRVRRGRAVTLPFDFLVPRHIWERGPCVPSKQIKGRARRASLKAAKLQNASATHAVRHGRCDEFARGKHDGVTWPALSVLENDVVPPLAFEGDRDPKALHQRLRPHSGGQHGLVACDLASASLNCFEGSVLERDVRNFGDMQAPVEGFDLCAKRLHITRWIADVAMICQ